MKMYSELKAKCEKNKSRKRYHNFIGRTWSLHVQDTVHGTGCTTNKAITTVNVLNFISTLHILLNSHNVCENPTKTCTVRK